MAYLEIDDNAGTVTGQQKLIRRVAFYSSKQVRRESKCKGTAMWVTPVGSVLVSLGAPMAPWNGGNSQVIPQDA